MFQQGRDLFGRIQAGSFGGLHHDARVLQNLLFGTLPQLATNDVCSPEEAQYENRNKNEIEEDQKFESPHKVSDTGRDCLLSRYPRPSRDLFRFYKLPVTLIH